MSNSDKILVFLSENRYEYCDDCISDQCGISPRQQVNQICNDRINQYIQTRNATCFSCGKTKITRSLACPPCVGIAGEKDAASVCGSTENTKEKIMRDFENREVSRDIGKLIAVGFQKAGYWLSRGEAVDFVLEQCDDRDNVLYAFVVDNSIKYIGKSTNTLRQRMQQYKTPGPTQSTNIKNRANIKKALEAGTSVEIYAFVDTGLFSYGSFRINLAEGLETSMINNLQTEWNEK